MAFGLRVRNSEGTVELDTNTQHAQLIGVYFLNIPQGVFTGTTYPSPYTIEILEPKITDINNFFGYCPGQRVDMEIALGKMIVTIHKTQVGDVKPDYYFDLNGHPYGYLFRY